MGETGLRLNHEVLSLIQEPFVINRRKTGFIYKLLGLIQVHVVFCFCGVMLCCPCLLNQINLLLFFQCEPSLWHFQDPAHPDQGFVKNVPICASYCNNWFNACRLDKTCVVNWLKDFNFTSNGNHCPSGSECKTFEAMYGNGEGLCNNMWGNVFYYEEDETSCMLMHFDKTCKNPNACGKSDEDCDKSRYSGCGTVPQKAAAEPPRT